MSMITTLLPPIAAASIAACAIIYAATAKCKVPLSTKEADILWKLHKQNTNCPSHKMHPQTTKKGEITGFQCQCGYKYAQQRPLMSRTLTDNSQIAADGTRKTKPSPRAIGNIASRT
jgi:hypothetical protein